MIPNRIAIIGDNTLAHRLARYCKEQGIHLYASTIDSTLKEVDLVIETTNLDLEQKKKNLLEIENHTPNTTTILTTSLSVSATESASWLQHPERVVGFGTFSDFEERLIFLVGLRPSNETSASYSP